MADDQKAHEETKGNTAVFDVDGTLVDSTYHHALAWQRAFGRHDLTIPVWQLHRAIGMGGDHIVKAIAGDELEAEHGDSIRAAHDEEFATMVGDVRPLEGAEDLLREAKQRGFLVVLASSGAAEQTERYIDLINGRALIDAWTTADDVAATKPEPDLIHAALDKVGGVGGVVIGDSTWDFVAAKRAGLSGLGLLTGGFTAEELTAAGASYVFESLVQLREYAGETALAQAIYPGTAEGPLTAQ